MTNIENQMKENDTYKEMDSQTARKDEKKGWNFNMKNTNSAKADNNKKSSFRFGKRAWMAGIGTAVLVLGLAGCGSSLNVAGETEAAGLPQTSQTQTVQEMPQMQGQMPGGREGFGQGQMPGGKRGFGQGQMPQGQPPEMNGNFSEGQMPGGREGFGQGQMPGGRGNFGQGQMPGGKGGFGQGQNSSQQGQMPGGMGQGQGTLQNASSPSEIVTSDVENSASALTVNEAAAETIVMSESNAQVKIESAGTYLITGSCSDGNITVKKGTTGVVLILKDLDLTSTSGATLSCNKGSEVKIVIEGHVTLTDAEDPADENSADAAIADAFDGAALKVKDGAKVYLTGSGTLNLDASSCKNGIKVGNEDEPSLVIDGDLTVNITAANDAINSGYDLTILSGTFQISAGDDGIHADRILTLGSENGGPVINIQKSYEGLEGSVVNLFGGSGTISASDDAVNAANRDGTYVSELAYSINITGGNWTVSCSGDGLDSNGNVNVTGGSTSIRSGAAGGEAGIDYDGSCYIADGTLTNYSGVAGPDGMGGRGARPGFH